MLEYLAARHDVTLVSFARDSDSPHAVDHLRHLCGEVHTVPMRRSRAGDAVHLVRSLLTSWPLTIVRDERAEMFRKLEELATRQPFDAIHSDQLSMAQYALWSKS